MPPELPDPGVNTIQGHVAMSHRFLEHAQRELDHGRRLQASEKVWGATAHALKAIALQRGWRHRSHTTLFQVSTQISQEFDRERDIATGMGLAADMHQNFYENGRPSPYIQVAIDNTADLVKSLDDIREATPRSFTVKDEEDQKRLGHLLGLKGKQRPAIGTTDADGFARKPDGGGDQSESSPAEPFPPDRPSPPAARALIPDSVSLPADEDSRPRGDQRPPQPRQPRATTPASLKPKSGHSSKGPTPKRTSTNVPGEIKRFARKAKKR